MKLGWELEGGCNVVKVLGVVWSGFDYDIWIVISYGYELVLQSQDVTNHLDESERGLRAAPA